MWLHSKAFRSAFLAFALVAGAGALAACTFTPLYGDRSQTLNLAYAEPASRLEQIIYQDLALRLGQAKTLDAPQVTISASASSRRVGRTSSGSPATTYEAIVTASVSVTGVGDEPGSVKTLYTASRKASASYTTNGQRLADQQALEDAQERAALAVAQTIRLLLAANL